jgi:hypothetical protein
MRQVILYIVLIFLFGCKESADDIQSKEQLKADLKAHNMLLLPENPTANDVIKLVVLDDCTYNVLSGVMINMQLIQIRKQFNGFMKWPCVIKNDTILIGKLPQGIYNVNYTLIDISQTDPENIVLSFDFKMPVSGK